MIPPDFIKVIPQPDRLVRKPDGAPLPEAGETVPNDAYWWRRLDDEDVSIEIVRDETEAPAAKARTATKKD